jgi:hypothetical protein
MQALRRSLLGSFLNKQQRLTIGSSDCATAALVGQGEGR